MNFQILVRGLLILIASCSSSIYAVTTFNLVDTRIVTVLTNEDMASVHPFDNGVFLRSYDNGLRRARGYVIERYGLQKEVPMLPYTGNIRSMGKTIVATGHDDTSSHNPLWTLYLMNNNKWEKLDLEKYFAVFSKRYFVDLQLTSETEAILSGRVKDSQGEKSFVAKVDLSSQTLKFLDFYSELDRSLLGGGLRYVESSGDIFYVPVLASEHSVIRRISSLGVTENVFEQPFWALHYAVDSTNSRLVLTDLSDAGTSLFEYNLISKKLVRIAELKCPQFYSGTKVRILADGTVMIVGTGQKQFGNPLFHLIWFRDSKTGEWHNKAFTQTGTFEFEFTADQLKMYSAETTVINVNHAAKGVRLRQTSLQQMPQSYVRSDLEICKATNLN